MRFIITLLLCISRKPIYSVFYQAFDLVSNRFISRGTCDISESELKLKKHFYNCSGVRGGEGGASNYINTVVQRVPYTGDRLNYKCKYTNINDASNISVQSYLGIRSIFSCYSMCDGITSCEYIAYDSLQHVCHTHNPADGNNAPAFQQPANKLNIYFRESCEELESENSNAEQTSTLLALPVNSTEGGDLKNCLTKYYFAGVWYEGCAYLDANRSWCAFNNNDANVSPFHPGSDWGFCIRVKRAPVKTKGGCDDLNAIDVPVELPAEYSESILDPLMSSKEATPNLDVFSPEQRTSYVESCRNKCSTYQHCQSVSVVSVFTGATNLNKYAGSALYCLQFRDYDAKAEKNIQEDDLRKSSSNADQQLLYKIIAIFTYKKCVIRAVQNRDGVVTNASCYFPFYMDDQLEYRTCAEMDMGLKWCPIDKLNSKDISVPKLNDRNGTWGFCIEEDSVIRKEELQCYTFVIYPDHDLPVDRYVSNYHTVRACQDACIGQHRCQGYNYFRDLQLCSFIFSHDDLAEPTERKGVDHYRLTRVSCDIISTYVVTITMSSLSILFFVILFAYLIKSSKEKVVILKIIGEAPDEMMESSAFGTVVCGCGGLCECHAILKRKELETSNEIDKSENNQKKTIEIQNSGSSVKISDGIKKYGEVTIKKEIDEVDSKTANVKKSKRCEKCRAIGTSRANNQALNSAADNWMTPDGYKSRRKSIWAKLAMPLYDFRYNGRHLFRQPADEDYNDLPVMLKVVDKVATGVAKVKSQVMQPVAAVSSVVNDSICCRQPLVNNETGHADDVASNTNVVNTPKMSRIDLNPGHIRSRNKAYIIRREKSLSVTDLKEELN